MADQRISTELLLDAVLTSSYKDAFSDARSLMSDLKSTTRDLKQEISTLGKEADHLDKIGAAAGDVRVQIGKLEKQVETAEKATEKFGDARAHFRKAEIGARALKSDLRSLTKTAKTAVLGIAAVGTAAAVALSPPDELQTFDQEIAKVSTISPHIDTAGIENAKQQIRDLSNQFGISAAEIAQTATQLTRMLGFEDAQQTLEAAISFESVTGIAVKDIEEDLQTAKISLGIDTPAETREFLQLLQRAQSQGIKIDNLDFGDLETITQRVGNDLMDANFQREFLTTIAFRQVDSFQFADYAQAFTEEFDRSIFMSPDMDTKSIEKAQEALSSLQKFGLSAEQGILGAMRAYRQLSEIEKVGFIEELAPVLGEMTVEVITRGSAALPQIEQQVNAILAMQNTLESSAEMMNSTWSGLWGRIGIVSKNSLGIMQEEFAKTFGPPVLSTVENLFGFILAHQPQIQNFFTGIKDTMTPIILRVWGAIKAAWPDVRQFAMDIWIGLKAQWDAIAPVAGVLANGIFAIFKSVVSFVKEHPKLVTTLIAGIAAWKAYRIATDAWGASSDFLRGAVALLQGHFHKLNLTVLQNAGSQTVFSKAAQFSTASFGKFKGILAGFRIPSFGGAAALIRGIGVSSIAALPGIGAMGAALWTAIAPLLPIILPIVGAIAAIAAGGYLVYKYWDPIKAFFIENFSTIRVALMILFPWIGLLVNMAAIVKQNWEPLKSFFVALWDVISKAFKVAWEAIKFVALSTYLNILKTWHGIKQFFGGLWEFVWNIFKDNPLTKLFTPMVLGIVKIVSPLGSFFSDFWNNIARKAGEVLNWITGKFKWISGVLDKMFGWLKKKNKELKDDIKDLQDDQIVNSKIATETTQQITAEIAELPTQTGDITTVPTETHLTETSESFVIDKTQSGTEFIVPSVSESEMKAVIANNAPISSEKEIQKLVENEKQVTDNQTEKLTETQQITKEQITSDKEIQKFLETQHLATEKETQQLIQKDRQVTEKETEKLTETQQVEKEQITSDKESQKFLENATPGNRFFT